jgi:chromosome segregation ATPase
VRAEKLASEVARFAERDRAVQDLCSDVQARIFRLQQRLAQLRGEQQQNQEELEQWIVVARQKEEDFLVLHRYEAHIRSLLLEAEKLREVHRGKRAELEREVTATRTMQIELDNLAEGFRAKHAERADILRQWEGTLRQMSALNERMVAITDDYDRWKAESERLSAEAQRRLAQCAKDHTVLERALTIDDHQISLLNQELAREEGALVEFRNSVEVRRRRSRSTTRACGGCRARSTASTGRRRGRWSCCTTPTSRSSRWRSVSHASMARRRRTRRPR